MIYLIEHKPGDLKLVSAPGTYRVVNFFHIESTGVQAHMAWIRLAGELGRMQRWLTRLDPTFDGVLDIFRSPPDDFFPSAVEPIYYEAWGVFDALVKSAPGDMIDKFRAMGEPPLLAYYFKQRSTPLSDRERAMYIQQEQTGWKPQEGASTDGRVKVVREPATGQQWPSAADLAAVLGCSIRTLYNHLGGNKTYPKVKGRVFEYVPTEPNKPLPGSVGSWTEAEKADRRAKALAIGWTPKF